VGRETRPGGQATRADPANGVLACVDELYTVYNRKPAMPLAPVPLLAGGCGTARKVGRLRPWRERSGRKMVTGRRRPGFWPNVRFAQPLTAARPAEFWVRLRASGPIPDRDPGRSAWAVKRAGPPGRVAVTPGAVCLIDIIVKSP
jgi:hypothetical protein